jgi:hypothetical protein
VPVGGHGDPAPRLPRAVESDPRHAAVQAALRASVAPLWPGAATDVPVVAVSDAIRIALRAARAAGHVERGLERIEAGLEAQAHGLRAAGMGDASRVSRLVMVADDGSERFYRQVLRLPRTYGPRVLVLRLRCDAATLGELLFGRGEAAKAVAVTHKRAVATILLALAGVA